MADRSISDVLTTAQNLVNAVNGLSETYSNVQGITNVADISTPTVVKGSPGRVAVMSVTTAGNATGAIYDNTIANLTQRKLCVIPMTVGIYNVNLPGKYGISVIPGSGQVLTVSYS